jgi:tetratricopeptide (TPR) repeat protein
MAAPNLAAIVATLAALAAPPKTSWDAVGKPEIDAEILPHSAAVEVDGRPSGRGIATLDVSDPKRTYRIRAAADGYQTEESVVEAGRAVNGRCLLALRPAGFAGPVDPEDPNRMAQAADALLRAGRVEDAADYAQQSLRTGRTALAHRVLGDVWRSRGDRDQATKYYTMYLSLADNPPDANEIKAWLRKPREGDITIPSR